MSISDDDGQLVRQLLDLLHQYGAGWVAAEVEERREGRAAADPEGDVAMLLVAISQTVGLIPEFLRDGAMRLQEVADAPDGIILGATEIPFDDHSLAELDALGDPRGRASRASAGPARRTAAG